MLDATTHYIHDLASNRLGVTIDRGNDGNIDERIAYSYDENDRLLSERVDTDGNGTEDRATTFAYGPGNGQTVPMSKVVTDLVTGAAVQSSSFACNLQGLLSRVVAEEYQGGIAVRRETTEFTYGDDGIRVAARFLAEMDHDGNPATPLRVESHTETTYLSDSANPTSYAQVIEATARDAATGEVIKRVLSTIGRDVISQTTHIPGGPEAGETRVLLYDGHGSTRLLTDQMGQVVQSYAYDAFGNALGFDPSAALTDLLYSGEPYDSRTGRQYLRARYYDPANGRFDRLDPFDGDPRNPLSLHKYLYTHGDPINGTDPSGRNLSVSLGTISIGVGLATFDASVIFGAVNSTVGYATGQFDFDTAVGSYHKYFAFGAIAGTVAGLATYGLLFGGVTNHILARLFVVGAAVGLTGYGINEVGTEGLLTGLNRGFFRLWA